MAILKCTGLCFAYDGKTVLEDVNFEIEQGDYLCIVGENGSGKSTLMRGLRPQAPSAGSITLGDGLRADEIGYLPAAERRPARLSPPASTRWCLWLPQPPGRRMSYGRAEKERAALNLERMGIEELKKRKLSGAFRRTAAACLARALCATKKLLLLDEPVTGLDPIAAQEMYNLIKTRESMR